MELINFFRNVEDLWSKRSAPETLYGVGPDDFDLSKSLSTVWYESLIKDLNIFYGNVHQWLPERDLLKGFKRVDEKSLMGRDVYLGLDLLSTTDLASLVCLFKDDDSKTYSVIPYFFFVNRPEKKIRKGGIDLTKWILQGHIIQCQTKTIDYDLILDKIKEINDKFNIVSLGYDQWNSAWILSKLKAMDIECNPFEQTARKFNMPLKILEKLVAEETIDLSDNPVMLWNLRNAVLYIDGNGNIKIMKNKSLDSVDGAVALGMAIGQYIDVHFGDEKAALDENLKRALN